MGSAGGDRKGIGGGRDRDAVEENRRVEGSGLERIFELNNDFEQALSKESDERWHFF